MSMTGSLGRQEGCQQRHLRVWLLSVLIACEGSSARHGDASVPTAMILFLPRAGGVWFPLWHTEENHDSFFCSIIAFWLQNWQLKRVMEVRSWPMSILPNDSPASTSTPLPTKVRENTSCESSNLIVTSSQTPPCKDYDGTFVMSQPL